MLVHNDMVKGIVILIGNAQKFGEIPESLEGILIIPFMDNDLVDFGGQMQISLGCAGNTGSFSDHQVPEDRIQGIFPVTVEAVFLSALFFDRIPYRGNC